MIENGCYHYKNCDDCDFEDCRVVKLQNTIKKQKLKLFAKAYNQGRKETASEIFETLLLFLDGETFTVGKELKKVRKKIIKMAEEMGVDLLDEELF